LTNVPQGAAGAAEFKRPPGVTIQPPTPRSSKSSANPTKQVRHATIDGLTPFFSLEKKPDLNIVKSMPYELHMKPKGELLYVNPEGHSDMQKAISDFEVLLKTCRASGTRRVLYDFRRLKNPFKGAGELFSYASAASRQYKEYINQGGLHLRIAYLTLPQEEIDEDFTATLSENFAFPAILTTDPDEAETWLAEREQ